MFPSHSSEEVAAFNASLDNWVNGVGEVVAIDARQRRNRERARMEMVAAYRDDSMGLSLATYRLTSLPPQIGQLTSLINFDISFNRLRRIPAEIANLRGLQFLDIKDNCIAEIPDQIFALTALRQLNVSNNFLPEISPQIGNLINLESVDFSVNEIEDIPPEMARLTRLRYLDIDDNNIETLPNFLFTDLGSIAAISVAENPIPEDELSRLRALHNSVARAEEIEFEYGYDSDEEEGLGVEVAAHNKSRFNLVAKQILELEPDVDLRKELQSWLETGAKSAGDGDAMAESPTDLTRFRMLIEQCSRTSSWTGEGNASGSEAVAEVKKGMCKILLQIIKAAYSDKRIANIVNETSAGSGVSCGDRVSMTLLDVQMAALHFNTPPKLIENADDLFSYAREKSVYDFLKKKAENYVKSKRRGEVDEVEVHLLYMQSLSNLGVGVDGLNMLYRKTIRDIGDDQLRAVESEYNGPLVCAAEGAASASDNSLMRDLKSASARIDEEISKMSYSEYLTYFTMLSSPEFSEVKLVEAVELLTPEMVSDREEFNCFSGKVTSSSGDSIDESDNDFLLRITKVKQESLKLKILVLREVHRAIFGAGVEILERDQKSLEVVEREDKEDCDVCLPTYVNIFDREVVEDLVRLKAQHLAELLSFKGVVEAKKACEVPNSCVLDFCGESVAFPGSSPDISMANRDKKGVSLKRPRAGSFDLDF